jgi:multiple sugar transport system substrate-binding protein
MVTLWYHYTNSREELMLNLIDEFNRTNEWGITVQGESQDSYTSLHEKIIAGIPDGRLPSISVAYQDQAADYAAQGVLAALDSYVESQNWGHTQEALDGFFPSSLDADYLPQFDGRYGWPFYRSTEVMYYNEDWLTELGYTGPPETWDEFNEMACAAAEQPFSGATGEGASYGYVHATNASQFAALVFSRGGTMINDKGTSYVFNGPEGLEALTSLGDLIDRGCAAGQVERNGDRNTFGAGRSLFTLGASSSLPHYRQAVEDGAGFTWSVNPLPHTTTEPRMNVHGASHSIFVSTPEEQLAAWLFIKWLSEPEQQAAWAAGSGYFATHQAAAELLGDYFAENPIYEKAFGFMSYDYGIEPSVAGYDACYAAIDEMLTGALNGEDAQSQLDAIARQCDQYLAEATP